MYACGAADAGAGVALRSMEGKKALGVNQKYLKLCSKDELAGLE